MSRTLKIAVGLICGTYALAQVVWLVASAPGMPTGEAEHTPPARRAPAIPRMAPPALREQQQAQALGSVLASATGIWAGSFLGMFLLRWARVGQRGRRTAVAFVALYGFAVLGAFGGLILLGLAVLRPAGAPITAQWEPALVQTCGACLTLAAGAALGVACSRPLKPGGDRPQAALPTGAGSPNVQQPATIPEK